MKQGLEQSFTSKRKVEMIDLETRMLLYLDERPRGSAKRADILKEFGSGISIPELSEILEEMEALGLLNLLEISRSSTKMTFDSITITDRGRELIN